MTKSNVLFGIGGLVIGAVAGAFGAAFVLRSKYEQEFSAKEDEMEEYYTHLAKYHRDPEMNPVEEESEEVVSMTPEKRKEIKEKLKRNYEVTTNYAAMYQNDEEELDEDDLAGLALTEENTKHMRDTPEILSLQAYSNLPASVDMEILKYYTVNDVLTSEDGEVLIDQELFVGDCLKAFFEPGLDEEVPSLLFVRNYAMNVAYEIQREDSEYYEG